MRSNTCFNAQHLAKGTPHGPIFTCSPELTIKRCRSASSIIIRCQSASTIFRHKSSLDNAKPSVNLHFRHSAIPNSSGVRGSCNPSTIPRTWSSKLPASSFSSHDHFWSDSCGPTPTTGSPVPTLVTFRNDSTSPSTDLSTTGPATITLPSHMGRLFPTKTPCILWGASEKCLGIIIPLTRWFSTVSATVPLKLCGIASNWLHVWVVPLITRACALTSKPHWFLFRKSLPITSGVPTSATSISCVPIVSPPVPSHIGTCTRPGEPTTLPSAHPIFPLFSFNGTFTSHSAIPHPTVRDKQH